METAGAAAAKQRAKIFGDGFTRPASIKLENGGTTTLLCVQTAPTNLLTVRQMQSSPHLTQTHSANDWFDRLSAVSSLFGFSEFLRHVDHGRRNRLPDFTIENDVIQLDQANAPLTSIADQKMLLKLLEQLTVMVRRKQDVFQQPSIRAALFNCLPVLPLISPKARQVVFHANFVKS